MQINALLAFDERVKCPGKEEAHNDRRQGAGGVGAAPKKSGAENHRERRGDPEEDVLHFHKQGNFRMRRVVARNSELAAERQTHAQCRMETLQLGFAQLHRILDIADGVDVGNYRNLCRGAGAVPRSGGLFRSSE